MQFRGAVGGIGFLDPLQSKEGFEENDTVALPLWMAVNVMDENAVMEVPRGLGR